MKVRNALMGAVVMFAIGAISTSAQPYPGAQPGNDPNGYYSQSGQNGHYQRMHGYYQGNYGNGTPPPPGPTGYDASPPAPAGAYYQEGSHERDCHGGNAAAGTIFGALAGGLIGSAASHGNGGAVVGGAVRGGLLGSAVSRDADCDDQPYAFRTYADGLNGDIGYRYDWPHGDGYGYFTPTRESHWGDVVCRDFSERSYRGGKSRSHNGTACRATDGNWRFD